MAGVHGNRVLPGDTQRSASVKALFTLEAFTGLTGMVGGVLLTARPDGSLLQMPSSTLSALARHSPFPYFFVPGLLLAVIVGGGMLTAAVLHFQRRRYANEVAVAAGGSLVIFEIVEYSAIGFMPLQAFEAIVGLLVLGMAARGRPRSVVGAA